METWSLNHQTTREIPLLPLPTQHTHSERSHHFLGHQTPLKFRFPSWVSNLHAPFTLDGWLYLHSSQKKAKPTTKLSPFSELIKSYRFISLSLLTTTLHLFKVKVLVTRSCPTLCNPMDCSPPGSSVHGVLQARILEWVAIPFSRGPSRPRDQSWVSHISGKFVTVWTTREALIWGHHHLRSRWLKHTPHVCFSHCSQIDDF